MWELPPSPHPYTFPIGSCSPCGQLCILETGPTKRGTRVIWSVQEAAPVSLLHWGREHRVHLRWLPQAPARLCGLYFERGGAVNSCYAGQVRVLGPDGVLCAQSELFEEFVQTPPD